MDKLTILLHTILELIEFLNTTSSVMKCVLFGVHDSEFLNTTSSVMKCALFGVHDSPRCSSCHITWSHRCVSDPCSCFCLPPMKNVTDTDGPSKIFFARTRRWRTPNNCCIFNRSEHYMHSSCHLTRKRDQQRKWY
jgi:hypothetical protein